MSGLRWVPVGLLAALCFTATVEEVLRVVDGDTFDARLRTQEVWLGGVTVVVTERVRVLGVDTPELKGATKEAALRARQATVAWLAQGAVEVLACRRDSFGRVLGVPTRTVSEPGRAPRVEKLAEVLVQAGHGVAQ